VGAAEAQVTAKQEALTEARTAAAEAGAAFCGAGEDYILALDRYGDVLVDTAPTVGDVVEAGADLAEPRDEVQTAAAEVTRTREAVVEAEQDLAEAEADLAAAQASAGGTPSPVATGETAPPPPTDPPAGLTQVQRAEAAFADAREGISDSTPLTEAAEQFNAAAVALEMAWFAAFAQSGCLTDDQHAQAAAAVREYTVALQTDLAAAGYYTGEVDGLYGPATVAAVQSLQDSNGLPATGTMDKASEAALRAQLEAAGGLAASEAMVSTAALQQTLALAGFWDGPVDGQWTDELTVALQEFQTELGVEPTGTVDAATVAAFQAALTAAQQPPTPSPEEPAAPTAEPPSAEATG
jgi:murein L,D-transpeptidase YcbB/YkuD